MWELRTKNKFGQIDQITKENCFTRIPVYDNLCKDGSGYNKANLTVEYTVEWLPERNYDAFDRSQFVGSGINPWELKDEYLTDSLGLAIRQMIVKEFDDTCDNVQLHMYIKDRQGDDAEVVTEIPSDTISILRTMVQDNINRKLDSYRSTIEEMTKEIDVYKSFVKECRAEKMLNDYKQMRIRE